MTSKYSILLALCFAAACSSDSTGAKVGSDSGHDQSVKDLGVKDTNMVDQNTVRDQGTDQNLNLDQGNQSDQSLGMDSGSADSGTDAMEKPDFGDSPFGGSRPAKVIFPDDYDATKSYPLVTLLHGYSANGSGQNIYLNIGSHATELQFILILPEGLKDSAGNQYWNATSGCCDFNGTNPDDSSYLIGLVDEAIARYNIDESRIYFMGHSNGGFMSYTMACEYGDRIAAIASLAGTTHLDPTQCPDTGDVSVLHIHGNLDGTININGGTRNGTLDGYPGASETVNRWATRNGCPNAGVDGENINIASSVPLSETQVKTWSGCENNTEVEYWRIVGGTHIPIFNGNFADGVLDFLLSKSK